MSKRNPPDLVVSATKKCRLSSSSSTDLLSWLTLATGINDLNFYESDLGSLGCFAKRNFAVGDLLFAVPTLYILTHHDANNSKEIALIREGVQSLHVAGALQSSPQVMTAELLLWVFMIVQLKTQQDSLFGPYMKSFDSTSPSPLSWPNDLLLALQSTNIGDMKSSIEMLTKQCALLVEVYEWGIINNKDTSFLHPDVVNMTTLTWARGHYLSRRYPSRFGGDKGSHNQSHYYDNDARELDMDNLGSMVPLLDILNHDDTHDYLRFDVSNECLRVVCNYPRKKGEELFSNYGTLSNEKLLFAFGFCIENNPHDRMTLKLICGSTSSSSSSSNEQIERKDGAKVRERNGMYYYVGRGGLEGIPKELWHALSSVIGDDEDNDPDQPPEVGLEEIQLLHDFIAKKLSQLEMSKSLAEEILVRYEDDIRARYIQYYRNGQTDIASELLKELKEIMINADNDDDSDDTNHEEEETEEGERREEDQES